MGRWVPLWQARSCLRRMGASGESVHLARGFELLSPKLWVHSYQAEISRGRECAGPANALIFLILSKISALVKMCLCQAGGSFGVLSLSRFWPCRAESQTLGPGKIHRYCDYHLESSPGDVLFTSTLVAPFLPSCVAERTFFQMLVSIIHRCWGFIFLLRLERLGVHLVVCRFQFPILNSNCNRFSR